MNRYISLSAVELYRQFRKANEKRVFTKIDESRFLNKIAVRTKAGRILLFETTTIVELVPEVTTKNKAPYFYQTKPMR